MPSRVSTKRAASRSTARTSSKSKKPGIISRLTSLSRKGQLLMFAGVFAVLGGGFFAYQSFANSYPASIVIRVAGTNQTLTFDARGTQPYDGKPHDVGTCGRLFTVTKSRTCPGHRVGPISITAPEVISGYTFTGWSGCDGRSRNGTGPSCWMRLYSRGSKTVVANYKANGNVAPAFKKGSCTISAPSRVSRHQSFKVNYSVTSPNQGNLIHKDIRVTQNNVMKWQHGVNAPGGLGKRISDTKTISIKVPGNYKINGFWNYNQSHVSCETDIRIY